MAPDKRDMKISIFHKVYVVGTHFCEMLLVSTTTYDFAEKLVNNNMFLKIVYGRALRHPIEIAI